MLLYVPNGPPVELNLTPTRAAAALERVEDPTFTDGDFTLISADNVVFKTHSYSLLGCSSVFRDAAAMCNEERTITFVDDEIETATVLRAFLGLINDGKLPPENGFLHVVHLLNFCKKYECHLATRCTLFSLRECLVRGELSCQRAMEIATSVDDLGTCVGVLQHYHFQQGSVAGIDPFLILRNVENVPLEYPWALARAIENLNRGKDDKKPLTYGFINSFIGVPLSAQADKVKRRDLWEEFKVLVEHAQGRRSKWKEPTLPDEPQKNSTWVRGDLTLVSSDNVVFRIPPHLVTASSSVLRAKVENGETHIQFTDSECATVIELYLDLISTGVLNPATDVSQQPIFDEIPTLCNLALFLHKYDCAKALETLVLYALQQCRLHGTSNPRLVFEMFVVAAIAGNHAAAVQIVGMGESKDRKGSGSGSTSYLSKCGEWSSEHVGEHEVNMPLLGGDIFSPSTWSFKQWCMVPKTYIASLERTNRHPHGTFAERFQAVLLAMIATPQHYTTVSRP